MITRQQWATGFLDYAGWPVSQEKVIALVAQASAEGSQARNNPLDTTEDAPTATTYNAAGVKDYATTDAGYGATLATFVNGRYPQLVAILKDPAGGSAAAYATNPELNTWGTGNCLVEVESIQSGDPHGYLSAPVNTSTGPPPVPPTPAPPAPSPEGIEMIAATSTGNGYVVARPTGAVFAYGDANFHGGANDPAGTLQPGDAIVGIALRPQNDGYWLTSKNGGVFAYGAADFHGAPE